MARTKEKMKYYTRKACALLLVAAIFCGAFSINAFAYTSFNGIEMIKNSADEFVILEIVPVAGSGSIGFYIKGQESTSAAITSVAEYNEKVNNLTAAGLYKTDGSAPLSPAQRIYPWQTVPSGAVEITPTSAQTVDITGTFTEKPDDDGAFDLTGVNSYEYVGTGGGYDFAEGTGTTATVSYNNYYINSAYTNNNWFNSFVLGDATSAKSIKVNSLTPNGLSTDEAVLSAQIASADLIVISAGLNITSSSANSMESGYETNDLTVAQARIIEDAVNDGKAIVLDSRIEEVEKTTGSETEPTNIAILARALISDSDAANGFVSGNVYCFTPDASRAHLATGGFNLDFGDALTNAETAPYYEVYSAIEEENELRRQALGSAAAPADYYMPSEITMAAAIRQILSLSFNAKEPVIQITDSTGANEMSNILIPTIYRESISATGADTLLLTEGNKKINIKLQDENEISRQMELFVYYEDSDGAYYLNTDVVTGEKSMLAIDASTPSGAQRYSRITISNTADIENALTNANAIKDLQMAYSLPNEIFNHFEALNENNLSIYIQATTTIGFTPYSALSNELSINKLGLFMIG